MDLRCAPTHSRHTRAILLVPFFTFARASVPCEPSVPHVGKKIWPRRTALRRTSALRLSAAEFTSYVPTYFSLSIRSGSSEQLSQLSLSQPKLTYLLFPLFALRFSYRVDCPLDKNRRRALIVDDCQWQERILSSQQIGRRFIVLHSIVIFFLFCLFRFAFTLHHIPFDEIRHWQNYLYKAICFSFKNHITFSNRFPTY